MYSGMLVRVFKLGMLAGFPVALGCCGKSLLLPCLSTAGLYARLIAFSLTSAVWGDGLQLWHALPPSASCQTQLHCGSLYRLKINFASRLAFQSFSSSANPSLCHPFPSLPSKISDFSGSVYYPICTCMVL